VNRRTRVIVKGTIGALVIGPNPMVPTFFYPQGSDRLVSRDPQEAFNWVKSKGGAVAAVDFVLPEERDVKVKASMMVFDAVGNLVYSRQNNDNVLPMEDWANSWVPGSMRKLVFYWNGITDRDTRAAPGIYRAIVNLEFDGKQERYVTNVGIGR
jgi:hypothetical protein